LQTLLEGVSRAVVENSPEDIAEFFALYFQELIVFQKESGNEGLEEKPLEFTDAVFSGEPKQKDKCTDTEEDQLLKEPDSQHNSKETQYPSIGSFITESQHSLGSDGASSPQSPELLCVPAQPAQLAAYVLANSESSYSLRDVATSVQTLHEDSETSENKLTPVESAAEDVSSVPPAEASLEVVGPQPRVWNLFSTSGELGPSDSQADGSANDASQASKVALWEEPSPLSSSPPSKDSLQTVPA
ncbi:CABYR protein, partial [Bucco capensis]|nr:CABYR protein [Bucco capensis]